MKFELAINIPAEAETGVFANFANIWRDDAGIVLDFAASLGPHQPVTKEDGSTVLAMRARVVSRVRVAPRQALELMRGLTKQLDIWEAEHGPVTELPSEQ